MKFRTGYNEEFITLPGDGENSRPEVAHATRFEDDSVFPVGAGAYVECRDESLTVQADAEGADINNIIKRFVRTGQLPIIERPMLSGDLASVSGDYQEMLHLIKDADDQFMKLPADVRAKFDNKPAKFVEFCSDDANLDAMRDMGLAVPKEPKAPAVAEPAEPAK